MRQIRDIGQRTNADLATAAGVSLFDVQHALEESRGLDARLALRLWSAARELAGSDAPCLRAADQRMRRALPQALLPEFSAPPIAAPAFALAPAAQLLTDALMGATSLPRSQRGRAEAALLRALRRLTRWQRERARKVRQFGGAQRDLGDLSGRSMPFVSWAEGEVVRLRLRWRAAEEQALLRAGDLKAVGRLRARPLRRQRLPLVHDAARHQGKPSEMGCARGTRAACWREPRTAEEWLIVLLDTSAARGGPIDSQHDRQRVARD
ncbi:hypothetical protein EPN44_10375 [bacterium]|nr:MAG: hypothetical protein EPN44_10375 [bacterium]